MGRSKIDRTGEVNYNNYGTKMIIIEYSSWDNIAVEFEDGSIVRNKQYNNFKTGNILNPYDKNIRNIGYIGCGKYNVSIDGKLTDVYITWRNMFFRCYSQKRLKKYNTYIDCTVSEVWHNFQNFGDWHDENYYNIEDETMAIDKDILVKNNKIYSPENCIFVPQSINSLFTKNDKDRGNLPIGVYFNKAREKYVASCRNSDAQIYLGAYKTPEKAFNIYKEYKEDHIKTVAEYYKDKIPKKLYDAMHYYEVEITD